MATSESNDNMCLVCLEAPAVRKVDTCQHSYCENCLSSPNFACPQCVTEGAEDQGVDRADELGKEGKPGEAETQEFGAAEQVKKLNCKLCHFKGKTVQAVNMCKECKSVPMCISCSNDHKQNKITENHAVTTLVAQTRKDVLCEAHDESLELFCTTCSRNICHLCISLDHVNHSVRTFNDVVHTEVEKVKAALKDEEDWLIIMKSDEKELQELKATAQEMEDVLIKAIEDHAEKCIEEILKNKEALKKQVKADFEVVRVMEKRLEAMPGLQRATANVVAEATSFLNEQAELHYTYIAKLVLFKQQLDKLEGDHPAYEEDRAKYQQTFKELCERAITFYPRTPNCKIGGFEATGLRCDAGGPCVCELCKRVFKWPGATRVDECRQKGTCTCGTCGCVFDRKKLKSDGCCIGFTPCHAKPQWEQCGFCRYGRVGSSSCIYRDSCIKIAIQNYIP